MVIQTYYPVSVLLTMHPFTKLPQMSNTPILGGISLLAVWTTLFYDAIILKGMIVQIR